MNALEYSQKAAELFAIPETATQIKRLSDSGKASVQDISSIVMLDPGLTAQILKLANSSIYRFSRKIETIDRAIQVIGVRAVYDYALVFSVANMLNKEQSQSIDVEKYWMQSLACAFMGKHIARMCGERDVHRVVTSGLLNNVGLLAVLRVTPNLVRDCERFGTSVKPKQSQQEALGFTFAEISASLLQRWLLPDSIVSTVAMQHHDDAPSVTMESQIMQLAYELSLVLTYPDYYNIERHVPSFLYQSLDITAEALFNMFDTVTEECHDTLKLFDKQSTEAA
ncbi:HDOD domain-containing protein [Glaciecola sp. XM2]|jgi:HD-like signal output (HDOD) protein|uniref:HDOD domain-containing protein n=1 Tax=Glaciecola sp. XM2 TaxID=1914931 RepID=UPI001BDE578F|nr:HDOD domain-containing protein [Glaciecola sp. XM2]MBT1449735.1 HDOD domain-containing protein [Glaciecola sp. XM2]